MSPSVLKGFRTSILEESNFLKILRDMFFIFREEFCGKPLFFTKKRGFLRKNGFFSLLIIKQLENLIKQIKQIKRIKRKLPLL